MEVSGGGCVDRLFTMWWGRIAYLVGRFSFPGTNTTEAETQRELVLLAAVPGQRHGPSCHAKRFLPTVPAPVIVFAAKTTIGHGGCGASRLRSPRRPTLLTRRTCEHERRSTQHRQRHRPSARPTWRRTVSHDALGEIAWTDPGARAGDVRICLHNGGGPPADDSPRPERGQRTPGRGPRQAGRLRGVRTRT